jgi:hypothetical protein
MLAAKATIRAFEQKMKELSLVSEYSMGVSYSWISLDTISQVA